MCRLSSLHLAAYLLAMIPVSAIADDWKDPSPHKSQFATVNGVKLHYLDWGGSGAPLVFLAGMASSAHTFDDLAPRFTDKFRVVGLTRRGTGASERPESGYTLNQLADDIKGLLDALGLQRVSLAGHSLGGDEITVFAGKYPDRVDKIVYLDGAFNRSKEFNAPLQEKLKDAPKDPLADRMSRFAPGPDAMASMEALKAWYVGNGWRWKPSVEANVRECWLKDGKLNPPNAMHPNLGRELMQSAQSSPPDFTKVNAPVLSLTAMRKRHPGIQSSDTDELKKQAAAAWEFHAGIRRAHGEHLKKCIPSAKIVEIDGDHGQFFHEREGDVYLEMRAFLTGS